MESKTKNKREKFIHVGILYLILVIYLFSKGISDTPKLVLIGSGVFLSVLLIKEILTILLSFIEKTGI